MNDQEQAEHNPVTQSLHAKSDWAGALSTVTPLFQASAFQTGSPYFYTRKNNPNSEELEAIVGALEGSRHTLAVTTGMTAISLVLTLLRAGDRILVNKDVYGCSYKYFFRVAERLGCHVDVLDLSVASEHEKIRPQTRLVIFETPTNPFLKTIDIRAAATAAKKASPKALVVVDNTWATPLFQRPLEFGADISLYSATKYFSGHSDVMGGLICTNSSELDDELRQERFYGGHILDPHSAWLLCRSMKTFPLRMREHQAITRSMASFLREMPQIQKVYDPIVDGKQLTGYGGILFFSFIPRLRNSYPEFIKHLRLFTTGTGMAAVTSMVAQPYSGSHASMTGEEKAAMGLGPELVRLCFGFEDPDDLKRDLLAAFKALG